MHPPTMAKLAQTAAGARVKYPKLGFQQHGLRDLVLDISYHNLSQVVQNQPQNIRDH